MTVFTIQVRCFVCGTEAELPPDAVKLVLSIDADPAMAWNCRECGDSIEQTLTEAGKEDLLRARCPIEHDAATVALMTSLKADLEGTT